MKYLIFLMLSIPMALFGQKTEIDKYGVDTSFPVPKGINVGDAAPMFQTKDVNGLSINLDELRRQGPVVLLFYRGQWCPVCSRFINNLNDSINLIKERGAVVIAIGPETDDNAVKMKKSTDSDFSFIADTSLSIHHAYDVLFHVTKKYQAKIKNFLLTDIAKNNGKKEAMLPVPATYIIGTDGKIVFKQFNYDYKDRATVEDILTHL